MTKAPAKRPRGRPPIPEEVQRRRLVTAAIRVFAEKPFEGARIADIVREAGMSSRSFYQFFESKEDVVVEVVHLVMGAFVRDLERVLGETGDPIQRIDRGLAAGLEIFAGGNLDLSRLGSGASQRVLEARTHYVRRIGAMVTRELEAAHAAGLVAEAPDPAAVELIITGIEGMGLRYMSEGRGPELRRLHPVLMGLLVRAFVGRPADLV
jgi:AcrR family transcriptional regulator